MNQSECKKRMRTRGFSGTLNPEISEREIAHRELARRAAAEGMVLLENNGILPLPVTTPLAIYSGGALYTIKGGTGSGSVNNRKNVSIAEGLMSAGYPVTTGEWLEDYKGRYEAAWEEWKKTCFAHSEDENFFSLYRACSYYHLQMPKGAPFTKTEAEVALYVVSRVSGESTDRQEEKGDYYLSDMEMQDLRTLSELYRDVILIINAGGVVDLSILDQVRISAVILMSQAGMEGGNALADVISGKTNPSGRLTDTWAYHYSDYPSYDSFSYKNGNLIQEKYYEGIYVGYRYFDSFEVKPRYAFGYGLSYTTFSQKLTLLDVKNGNVNVKALVTNTGSCAGRDVVLLFADCPDGIRIKEKKRLVAFAKTRELLPGESQELQISFPIRALESYHTARSIWYLDSGQYLLFSATSAEAVVPFGILTLSKMTITEQAKPICPLLDALTELVPPEEIREKQQRERKALLAEEGLFVVDMTQEAGEIVRKEAQARSKRECETEDAYEEKIKEQAREVLARMTPLQKAQIVCGQPSQGSSEVIGNAAIHVPGAAGETSGNLTELGISSMILADGPAGIRVSRRYEENPEDHSIYHMTPYQGLQNRFFGTEFLHEGSIHHYQFCSAIPVGTLLAQTFDTELLTQVGELIGREMKEIGVTLWLAPGMNIHRNPLCGRNFEYYSEDPLVSGLMAAAITRGVQHLPGIGTTIKHFACNNQEENRMGVSSIVSERALREIYLKGFELAVKTAQPMAIMTSYNRLNSVHTANSYDLCTQAARKEWDFAGIIMTDWVTTNQDHGSSAVKCIQAGNDLIMPGNESDIRELLDALDEKKDLSLSMEELDTSVLRMLEMILRSDAMEDSIPYQKL